MADQMATRFGMLGRELSHAVLQIIALTARDGVNALCEVHRRLGGLNAQDGYARAERPDQRWREMLEDLFPAATVLVGDKAPSDVLPERELVTNQAEERTIRSLFLAVATFLLSETMKLDEQIDLWAVVDADVPGLDELESTLLRASRASRAFLNHAEEGTWRQLLVSRVRASQLGSNEAGGDVRAAFDERRPLARTSPRMMLVIHALAGSRQEEWSSLYGHLVEVIKTAEARHVKVEICATQADGPRSDLTDLLRRIGERFAPLGVTTKMVDLRKPGTPDIVPSSIDNRLIADLCSLSSIVEAENSQRLLLVVGGIDLVGDGSTVVGWKSSGKTLSGDGFIKVLESLREQGILPALRNIEVDVVGVSRSVHESFWRELLLASGAKTVNVVRAKPVESSSNTSARTAETELASQQARIRAFVDIVDDPGRTRRAALMVAALSIPAVLTVVILGLVAVKSGAVVGAVAVGGLVSAVIVLGIKYVLSPMTIVLKNADRTYSSGYRGLESHDDRGVDSGSNSVMSAL